MPDKNYTPEPWQFRQDGLYSGEFPILWVARDCNNQLYLGVNADDEELIAGAPGLMAALEQIEETLAKWDKDGKLYLPGAVAYHLLGLASAALAQVRNDGA